jgi:hypothetical protein
MTRKCHVRFCSGGGQGREAPTYHNLCGKVIEMTNEVQTTFILASPHSAPFTQTSAEETPWLVPGFATGALP